MSKVKIDLLLGEKPVYIAKLHWIIYLPGFILCLTIVGLILGIPLLIGQWLKQVNTVFVVTNQRVIMRYGILRRRSMEMLNSKIEEVDVNQTVWGRIFGYGTVRIIGIGGSRDPVDLISNPALFKSAVLQQAQNPIQR